MFNRGVIIRVRPIPCKLPHRMGLVTCPCAFLTAQARANYWSRAGRMAFFLLNFFQNGSCEMSMCMPPAQARTKQCPQRCPRSFFLQISIQNGFCTLSMSCAGRWRRLAQNDVAGGVRGPSSCQFVCQMALVKCPRRRAQNETSRTEPLPRGRLARDLAQRAAEILLRDLAKRLLPEILPTELLDSLS